MPEMQPVGNTITTPDPLGSISKMIAAKSGMIGIQQQQQALQTGQYQQATAQATSQQAQQQNSELQGLAKFTVAASSDPSYLNSDGSPNIGKFQQGAMKVAPVYGADKIGQWTSNFNEAVQNRKALQSLSAEQNKQIADALKGVASLGPNATRTDLMNAVEQQRANNKDPGFNRALDNFLLSVDHNNIGQSAAAGAASLGGPAVNSPSSLDTGGQVTPGATNAYTGKFTPAQAPINKTLSPTIVTNPTTGGPVQVGGGQGTTAQPLVGPGMQPAAGQQQIQADIDAARKIGDAVPINRDINTRILKLATQTTSGPGSNLIHQMAAAAGLPSGSSYQELGAFLDRQAALAQQSMGLPNTNAGMETAKAFTGNTQYNNQVIKDKTHFVDALNTAAGAYREGLDKIVGTGPTPNYAAYQGFRGAWAKNFDPNVFAYENAVKNGDTATQQEIEKDEGRKGMATLLTKRRALMSLINGQ